MKKPKHDLATLLDVARETPAPWCQLFAALADTGARYSELAFLTWECVELREDVARISIAEHTLPDGRLWRPKRPSSIRIVFTKRSNLPAKGAPTAFVYWPPATFAPPTVRSANRRLSTAARLLGLATPPTTHDFRRARIVHALAAGGDPNTVRAAVGHRSLASTLEYLRGVPLQAELPPLESPEVVNPAAAQYAQVFRKRNWK